MKTVKITNFFIFASILNLFTSCHHKTGQVRIGHAGFDPDRIIVTDPTGKNNNLRSFGIKETVDIDTIEPGIYHLKFTFSAAGLISIRSLEIPLQFMADSAAIREEVRNSFHWVPNLKKDPGDIFSEHVFRSPAIILTHKQSVLSVIPDLEAIKEYPETPCYLDLNLSRSGIIISYGLSNYRTKYHVYYEHADSSFILPEKTELGLYLITSNNFSPLNIVKKTNSFMWNTYGKNYVHSILPQVLPFRKYADIGYAMALSRYWVDGPDPRTGGITLSTYLDKSTSIYRGRDYKDDLWFHSWFNNARTAYGLYLWGYEAGNKVWQDKALCTMNLLLNSPRDNGFFKTIWVPEKNGWVASGQGGGPGLYHVPDNAWTAIWLLRFNDELRKLSGADKFLLDFTNGLLGTQLENGSFPARIRVSDLKPDSIMMNSASGSLATWFLEEMILRKKLSPETEAKAVRAVNKSLSFLEKEILPGLRFQDFEVFFSCAPNSLDSFDSLTWLCPHNTLSIQWSAEAFLKAYKLFNRKSDLDNGEFCLNILSLYQQVWNPPIIDFYAFGGFGVQNTDAEWSDARQAQFAETYLDYFLTTRNQEYLERGVAACRASFALMAIPENKSICPQNYEGTSFNGEFMGAMAENFGHSGYNKRSGQSGFHWGTGSALTTAAIFRAELGDIYLDFKSHTATGIDGVVVDETRWGDTVKLITSGLADSRILEAASESDELIGKKVSLSGDESFVTVKGSKFRNP
jgi:hypothetical protein